MKQPAVYLTNPLVLDAASVAVEKQTAAAQATALGELLPDTVRTWLARLRLLEGVPFEHLVADEQLLPLESIRFFYLDREWTDALTEGALAVGAVSTLDRETLQALYGTLRDEIDTEEHLVRMAGSDRSSAPRLGAGTISGFLLRSRAVSGWPGLHVRAYDIDVTPDDAAPPSDTHRVGLLRLERLAPAVLLCLFDGIPKTVHIEEPRQGLQFGVDLVPGADGTAGATVPLRDVLTAEDVPDSSAGTSPKPPLTVAVPFRQGAPGVVDMTTLAARIAAEPKTNVSSFEGAGVQAAELALELLRFPYRQVFGATATSSSAKAKRAAFSAFFAPTIGIDTVRAWEEEL